MKLTPKQEKFCQEYIKTGNASEAYRLSYDTSKMKPESVNRLAKALFDNVKIRSRIEELQAEIKSEFIAEVSDLQKFWTDTLKNEELNYNFRLKASELLGKSKGAFVDKIEHSGGVKIIRDSIRN